MKNKEKKAKFLFKNCGNCKKKTFYLKLAMKFFPSKQLSKKH